MPCYLNNTVLVKVHLGHDDVSSREKGWLATTGARDPHVLVRNKATHSVLKLLPA